ncbi:DUF1036 domain-containing protein [Rhizobiaceae bacterium]|nr:DUF1036 domain-containing protein [Rhizobiaceae bacterium]
MLNRFVSIALLAFAASVANSVPARADLKLCNDTERLVGVALGYRSDTKWVSEGWWRIPPETCASVIEGDLATRYVYLHAENAGAKEKWLGRVFMCTSPKMFRIEGRQDCFARGHDRSGFFEVDTGEQKNWQVRLSDISKTSPTPDALADEPLPEQAPTSQPKTNP